MTLNPAAAFLAGPWFGWAAGVGGSEWPTLKQGNTRPAVIVGSFVVKGFCFAFAGKKPDGLLFFD
jgi:hypothetical protein